MEENRSNFRSIYELYFEGYQVLARESPLDDLTVSVHKVLPVYKYVNNEKTEEIEGYRYVASCSDGKYISVKILGDKLIHVDEPVKVRFKGLKGKPYINSYSKRLDISIKAEGLEVV